MGVLSFTMNKEIQEAIQYIDSVIWYLESDKRTYLISLMDFAIHADEWAGKSLNDAVQAQILQEAKKLKENYEFVEENVLKQVKVLRAKA